MGSSNTRIRALASHVDLGEWVERAACGGRDPEVWYPVSTQPDAPEVRAAQAVCAECPVRAECLEAALGLPAYEDRWGVWGGLTPRQRDRIRRDRGETRPAPVPAACGTTAGYKRHQVRDEPPCEDCRGAQRDYNRARRARREGAR